MNPQTWTLISRQFSRFRTFWAEPVKPSEFDEAFRGLPTAADYREFVLRVGGGIVGDHPIFGLRLAEAMGTLAGESTAPAITKAFRRANWPGAATWLIVSTDGFGNPIGLAEDGSVWISDAPRNQIQRLADTFEAFLLKWALRVDNPQ